MHILSSQSLISVKYINYSKNLVFTMSLDCFYQSELTECGLFSDSGGLGSKRCLFSGFLS